MDFVSSNEEARFTHTLLLAVLCGCCSCGLFVWLLHLLNPPAFLCFKLFFIRGLEQTNTLWSRSWSPGAMKKYSPWTLLTRMVSLIPKKIKNLFLVLETFDMQTIYITAYKKSMEEAIHSETSGHFSRILVSLVQVTSSSPWELCLCFVSTPTHWLQSVCWLWQRAKKKYPFNHTQFSFISSYVTY